MEFICCEYLLNQIVFSQDSVIPCCCSPSHNYKNTFINDFDGEKFNINQYMKTRKKYIEILKEGKTPDSCIGCNRLIKKEWDESCKINRIIITNRTKCSCNCIYCSLVTTSNQTKEELNTRESYTIIPVLKDMYNNNLIAGNCLITVAGGECSEYPSGELEYIIYLASLLNCRIEILSSGIIYSHAIENALKLGNCSLKISVDSGIKSTYEKIKRVKAYNKVWDNLRKYNVYANKENNSILRIKYIIIPNLNDNLNEIKSFINKCKEINNNTIEVAIEYLWFDKNKYNAVSKNIRMIHEYLIQGDFDISYEQPEVQNWLYSN